jgi:hypothetical protein
MDENSLLSGEYQDCDCKFPIYVGELIIIDLHYRMTKKPSKWALWWMKVLLGWLWRDIE